MATQTDRSTNSTSATAFEKPIVPQFSALAGAMLIAVLTLVIYLPSLSGDFILDDDVYLTNSRFVAAPDGWYRFWLSGQPMDYYPVSNGSLWIEWRLWGMHSTGYHITNLFLHIVSALLIWKVLKVLAVPGAFLAALLFTVHPVNVESVAWISQRKDLLAVVFSLISVLWYLKADERARNTGIEKSTESTVGRSTGKIWYWLSLLIFLLAMLSKGSAAIIPPVLLGLIWWRRRRITLADVTRTVPFFLIAIVFSLVSASSQTRGFSDTIRSASVMERAVGAGAMVWFYLSKALVPIDLLFIYPQWQIQTHDLLWWISLAAALGVTFVLWRKSLSSVWCRSLLFAWGFFCVALVPVLGFADVGFMRYSLVADHYQHFAIIGVVGLAAAGYEYWRSRISPSGVAPPILAAAAIALLSVLTWQQASLYSGPIKLYSNLLEQNPECSLARYNLGNALLKANRPEDAIAQYELTLRSEPNKCDAEANLGAALVMIGKPQAAIEHYQRAIHLKPDSFDALANMALAYAALNRPAEAIAAGERAIILARSHDEAALAQRIEDWLKNYRSQTVPIQQPSSESAAARQGP